MGAIKRSVQGLCICMAVMLLVPGATAAAQQMSAGAQMEMAKATLSRYVADFLTEKNVSRYGFRSLKEAQSAKLGEPLPVMVVGLSSLKEYREGMKMSSMLIDAKTLWYPVLVNDETMTKLEMIVKDSTLVPGEFGGIRTPERIAAARKMIPRLIERGTLRDLKKTSLVKIPALGADFLYLETGHGDYFLPAMENPERLKLEAGKLYRADELFLLLRDVAKEIDPKKVM
jgi:hypothetical protein